MIVNDGAGGADLPPPFGIGGLTAYAGAVESFVLFAGPYGIQAGASSPKSLFVYNDVPGASPTAPARLDQFTYNAGVDFSAGFKPHIELDPAAGPNLFVSNLVFGRTQSGSVDALPTMLTSTAIPDLPSVWRPDVQMLFLFDVRQGVPASSAAMRQLPVARFTVTNLNFGIVALPAPGAVPEPATWALFIAGFGLVGGSLRRRRAAQA